MKNSLIVTPIQDVVYESIVFTMTLLGIRYATIDGQLLCGSETAKFMVADNPEADIFVILHADKAAFSANMLRDLMRLESVKVILIATFPGEINAEVRTLVNQTIEKTLTMQQTTTRGQVENWCKANGLSFNYRGSESTMYVDGKDVHKKLRHNFMILLAPFKVKVASDVKKVEVIKPPVKKPYAGEDIPVEELEWLTNTYDPRKDDAPAKHTYLMVGGSPQQQWEHYRQWLRDKFIDRPKATDAHTVEELEAMGMVGIYRMKQESPAMGGF